MTGEIGSVTPQQVDNCEQLLKARSLHPYPYIPRVDRDSLPILKKQYGLTNNETEYHQSFDVGFKCKQKDTIGMKVATVNTIREREVQDCITTERSPKCYGVNKSPIGDTFLNYQACFNQKSTEKQRQEHFLDNFDRTYKQLTILSDPDNTDILPCQIDLRPKTPEQRPPSPAKTERIIDRPTVRRSELCNPAEMEAAYMYNQRLYYSEYYPYNGQYPLIDLGFRENRNLYENMKNELADLNQNNSNNNDLSEEEGEYDNATLYNLRERGKLTRPQMHKILIAQKKKEREKFRNREVEVQERGMELKDACYKIAAEDTKCKVQRKEVYEEMLTKRFNDLLAVDCEKRRQILHPQTQYERFVNDLSKNDCMDMKSEYQEEYNHNYKYIQEFNNELLRRLRNAKSIRKEQEVLSNLRKDEIDKCKEMIEKYVNDDVEKIHSKKILQLIEAQEKWPYKLVELKSLLSEYQDEYCRSSRTKEIWKPISDLEKSKMDVQEDNENNNNQKSHGETKRPTSLDQMKCNLKYSKRSWGDNKYHNSIIPGYTGYIPGQYEYHGESDTKTAIRGLADLSDRMKKWEQQHEKQKLIQEYHRSKLSKNDPRIAADIQTSRIPQPLEPIQVDAAPYLPKHIPNFSQSPYDMPDCPEKYMRSKYMGFVPIERNLFGNGHQVATHDALVEFDKRRSFHKKFVKSTLSENNLLIKANEKHDGKLNTIYRKENGLVPNYTGHVPGIRFMQGDTYGHITRDAKGNMNYVPKKKGLTTERKFVPTRGVFQSTETGFPGFLNFW
ncbi:hypothetical protein SNEBB_011227 [Seison nebaliae]|nr:hypothetical protein SNEBB_011227 [Seison nebaliae]